MKSELPQFLSSFRWQTSSTSAKSSEFLFQAKNSLRLTGPRLLARQIQVGIFTYFLEHFSIESCFLSTYILQLHEGPNVWLRDNIDTSRKNFQEYHISYIDKYFLKQTVDKVKDSDLSSSNSRIDQIKLKQFLYYSKCARKKCLFIKLFFHCDFGVIEALHNTYNPTL